jgi:hypothetical protein
MRCGDRISEADKDVLELGVCIDPVRDNDRCKDFEGGGVGSVRATKAK